MNDLCPHCKYSLSGLPANARCPECGKSRYHTADKPPLRDTPSAPSRAGGARMPGEPPPPDRVLTRSGVRIDTPAPPAHPTAAQPQNTRYDAQFISEHTKCGGCGYDLYGLRVGNACPECGRVILPSIQRAGSSNLVEAPIPYISKLGAGFALMASGVTTLAACLALLAGPRPAVIGLQGQAVTMNIPILRFQSFIAPVVGGSLILAAAALWFLGVLVISGPRPTIEKASPALDALWRRLALWSRATQACLVAAPLLVLAMTLAPGLPAIVHAVSFWAALGLLAIGLIGWWPTGWLTSEVADWASDTDLARQIKYAVFGMGTTSLLLILGNMLPMRFGGAAFALWSWILYALAFASLVTFLVSTFRLARLMADAVWIAKGMQGRDQRLVEKMNKERQAHLEQMRRAPAEPDHTADLTRKVGTVPQQNQRPK